jgi:hypothetical protein
MKLNVNFTALKINAAKMKGLEAVVSVIREERITYNEGLSIAQRYTLENNGTVQTDQDNGTTITILSFDGFTCSCFQPHQDIDLFYYES